MLIKKTGIRTGSTITASETEEWMGTGCSGEAGGVRELEERREGKL